MRFLFISAVALLLAAPSADARPPARRQNAVLRHRVDLSNSNSGKHQATALYNAQTRIIKVSVRSAADTHPGAASVSRHRYFEAGVKGLPMWMRAISSRSAVAARSAAPALSGWIVQPVETTRVMGNGKTYSQATRKPSAVFDRGVGSEPHATTTTWLKVPKNVQVTRGMLEALTRRLTRSEQGNTIITRNTTATVPASR